jgi:hypothetical protein
MNRTEFLKSACTQGLCGCLGISGLLNDGMHVNPDNSQNDDQPDWRIDFMQNRFKDLITILVDTLDKDTLIPILNQLGGKCGEGFAKDLKNNPEGFFNFIKQ